MYQNDMPEQCETLLYFHSIQYFENIQQVNEFIDRLNSHMNYGNFIDDLIKSKIIKWAKNKEFRGKIIEFVNTVIHQGYDYNIEALASSEDCSIEELIQCLPNLIVYDKLSEDLLKDVQTKLIKYIKSCEQQVLSRLIEILKLGMQYQKMIIPSDEILSLVKNENLENKIRLQAASILAYYDECKKLSRKALSKLKLDKITNDKTTDVIFHYYMDKYSIKLDKDSDIHLVLIHSLVSESKATEGMEVLFKDSFDYFYKEHKDNRINFDLIINSVLDSINQMLYNADANLDQIKEMIDLCSEGNFDWRLIYACQFFECKNKYEFIIRKCMTMKLKKYGILGNLSQDNISQFWSIIKNIGWSLKSIDQFFKLLKQHNSRENFVEFLEFIEKYKFEEKTVMILSSKLGMQKFKENKTFLQDLSKLCMQIRILEKIFRLEPEDTTDLIGIQDLLLQWIFQVGWSLDEVSMVIERFEDIDDNDILTIIEQFLSLIIAYKLKLDSEIDGKSLRDIIEEDIDDWYKLVSDLGMKVWLGVSKIKQKDQIWKELLENNTNKRVIDFAKEKLVMHLNQIEKMREKGKSFDISTENSIGWWNQDEIKDWAAKIKESGKIAVMNRIDEVYAVICHAVKLGKNYYPRNTQITTALLSSLESESNVLHQVSTGEGKTLTIAIHAIILSLFGHKVDIVTSSEILARRDSMEMEWLYLMFNISVSHNCYENSGEKIWYDRDVVYGDIKNFQGDHLRHHFKKENTRKDRKYDKVIIDEVDNMLLDNVHHITMLSNQDQGFWQLDIFIRKTWCFFKQFAGGFFSVDK